MIDWCAYCQTWQGEIPPLDSWVLSHGICRSCFHHRRYVDRDAVKAIMPIAEFFGAIREQARRGFSSPGAVVLENAESLGIRPVELLVGLLQPALDEIGQLWECGEATVAAEHRFSAMVQSVATLVLQRARAASDPSPEFLLVNAEGNHHVLGLLVAEAFLLSHRRTVVTLVPGLPAAEVIAQVGALQPTTLGISVARPGELEMVTQVGAALAELPPSRRPHLVVGGSAIRRGARPDRALDVTVCTDLREILTPGWPVRKNRRGRLAREL